ncbi:MAG: methylmalonyl Co-A mutase-associated GTPase MeaB [Gemmatimonadales bacterium]|nr:methylmalonyl Co-A mutase-associated GTPase MeaB [Gemmatimonadales bacterium]
MSQDEKPNKPSALHVRKGVDGGHDGLSGKRLVPSDPDNSSGESGKTIARRRPLTASELIEGILAGDRVLLARAITLIESGSPEHQDLAQEILTEVLPRRVKSVRVGITGVPGAGKSTFIEALGTGLTAKGHKVAVTAVDPSSTLTGGSILGDKTRMEKLAADPNAFIRPSPSGGTLGGVARKTRETILLFEAAGYDVILVETVGVGQSEVLVRSMVDFFLVMLLAGAGDELQGIKKGVVEIADAVLVNKADGAGTLAAQQARAELERVLHYLRPATDGWRTHAFHSSARTGEGVMDMWSVVERYVEITRQSGKFDHRRMDQERQWMRDLVKTGLEDLYKSHPAVRSQLAVLEEKVARGDLPATTAAKLLLEAFLRQSNQT